MNEELAYEDGAHHTHEADEYENGLVSVCALQQMAKNYTADNATDQHTECDHTCHFGVKSKHVSYLAANRHISIGTAIDERKDKNIS